MSDTRYTVIGGSGTRYTDVDGRSLSSVVNEIKEELKEFVDTRVMLAKSELRETMQAIRVGLPMGVIALVFVATGYLLLTVALVGLVAVAFWGNPYVWFFSFLIVGGLWFILGALAGYFAYNQFRSHGMFMKRTMTVLQQDKVWIQNEARSQV